MKTFKTPKGTELPLSDIKGKDYLQVAYRLVWFREDHPDWTIKTERIDCDDNSCLFKAEIINEAGRSISQGHKREHRAHFQDFEEKSETGAIGRALAHLGYGTQFSHDLEEGSRVVDSPQEPKKENEKKKGQRIMTIGKFTGKPFEMILKEDSAHDFQYSKWLKAQTSNANTYGKLHADQKAFYNYAKEEGAIE